MFSAWIDALRVRQWHKNLLVFIPLVFAFRIAEFALFPRVIALFAIFCGISSAVYLGNDIVDRERDAAHPLKRQRAVASGRVTPAAAGLAGASLAALSLGAAFLLLPAPVLVVLAAYLLFQGLYNGALRSLAGADVIVVALGFVFRAVAGALAIGVPFSEWLVICTFFGAARLVLGKRQAELRAGRTGLRRAWEGVSDDELRVLGGLTSSVLVLAYTLYCFSSHTAFRLYTASTQGALPPLLFSLPVAYYGVLRYEMIASAGEAGDPEMLPLRDPPLALAIVAWFAVSVAALYLRRMS